jgi:hypothetical protein
MVAWVATLLFPATIALAELPTYFAYDMPRLEVIIGRWSEVVLAGLALAAQHMTLPLIFDGRFLVWRLGMFLPFALLVAIVLRWPPRSCPTWPLATLSWICRW